MKGVAAAATLLVLVAAPAAWAYRAPYRGERREIIKALPRVYHESCIRYTIRVSDRNPHVAAVFFTFTSGAGCRRFGGAVLMRRRLDGWRKIAAGASFSCRTPGVTARVITELFGRCRP